MQILKLLELDLLNWGFISKNSVLKQRERKVNMTNEEKQKITFEKKVT